MAIHLTLDIEAGNAKLAKIVYSKNPREGKAELAQGPTGLVVFGTIDCTRKEPKGEETETDNSDITRTDQVTCAILNQLRCCCSF